MSYVAANNLRIRGHGYSIRSGYEAARVFFLTDVIDFCPKDPSLGQGGVIFDPTGPSLKQGPSRLMTSVSSRVEAGMVGVC